MTNSVARKSLTECVQKRQVIDFIKPRCSDLLTEDVLNNQSFIAAMAFPLVKIKEFVAWEEKYSSKQAKKSSTTDLSKTIEKIKGQIKNLDEKCKETSQIKVDILLGTERLCVASSQKQMMLTQVATMALEIRHIIETSSVLRKLKMRISQQANRNSNMVKEIVKPETVLQCYNSDLNWENAYAGLENNPFSGKISSVKITHSCPNRELFHISGNYC